MHLDVSKERAVISAMLKLSIWELQPVDLNITHIHSWHRFTKNNIFVLIIKKNTDKQQPQMHNDTQLLRAWTH